jgi:hypothetical protein
LKPGEPARSAIAGMLVASSSNLLSAQAEACEDRSAPKPSGARKAIEQGLFPLQHKAQHAKQPN